MLRVKGLVHYGLQVPSLEVGESFYRTFGLETAERGDSVVVRCEGREQDQTVLVEGPVKRLHHVAFAVEEGSLPEWQRHLEGLGVRLVDGPAEVAEGLWLRDHEGNLINLRDERLAPWRDFGTTDAHDVNFGDRIRRVDQARWLNADEAPKPRRLGHMLIFSSDLDESEAFYARTLGLRLSDRIRGMATFMNSGPGDHHVFGFVPGTHPGLHHSSWEVADIDQIARGAQAMAAAGHQQGWGLGRTPSDPISSTTSGTRGAVGSSTPATWTASRRTGRRTTGTARRPCGVRRCPLTSSRTRRRSRSEPLGGRCVSGAWLGPAPFRCD